VEEREGGAHIGKGLAMVTNRSRLCCMSRSFLLDSTAGMPRRICLQGAGRCATSAIGMPHHNRRRGDCLRFLVERGSGEGGTVFDRRTTGVGGRPIAETITFASF
jgi:hypothetical protein